ncbi:hypothetical protein BH23THE1_BH23THE1_34840 [soil metagenome]
MDLKSNIQYLIEISIFVPLLKIYIFIKGNFDITFRKLQLLLF